MKHLIYISGLATALLFAFSCTKLDSGTILGEWNVEVYSFSEEETQEDGLKSTSSTHIGDRDEWCTLIFKGDGTGVQTVTKSYDEYFRQPRECGEKTFNWSLKGGTLKFSFLTGRNCFESDEFDVTAKDSKLYLLHTIQEDNKKTIERITLGARSQ